MGHTLEITISDALYDKLREKAIQQGQQPEQFAAQWLENAVASDEFIADDPLDALIGSIHSGGIPWGEQHDLYLWDTNITYLDK